MLFCRLSAFVLTAFLLVSGAAPVLADPAAAPPIEYSVTFENAVHHEARISVTWRNIGATPLELRLSRSSPGRYAIHEFAKNVYAVEAVDGAGRALTFTRPSPYQWDVAGHDGTVKVTYTLYADRAGGTYSGIDLTHAHLNMPATFMWARGLDDRAITISFTPSDPAWKVATQLVPTDDAFVFSAPGLQYFMDSPTELSDFDMRVWERASNGKTYAIRLFVHHDGTPGDVDLYFEKMKKVVDAQIDVFGELPDFDYGTYSFIADYLPHVAPDGMEHRNSTFLVNTSSLYEGDFDQIATLSHEFIHAWNAERIRPSRLEPFDFEQANMSLNLWFMEGFTSYYGPLTVRRAGLVSVVDYTKEIVAAINTVSFAPGRRFASAQGMSIQAPFRDAATAIDPTNFSNTFISYYTYGHAIALALDLTLRSEFEGVTLDTFMREVWQKHGKTEIPYTTADLQRALAAVTADADFAARFFKSYITGRELPDYTALLASAGLTLTKANPDTASAGPVTLRMDGKAAYIAGNTIIGSPLYEAGLDSGDQILTLGRLKITSEAAWTDALGRFKPGEKTTITYIQRGIERSSDVTVIEDPTLEIVTDEQTDSEKAQAGMTFRDTWLGPDSATVTETP